MNITKFSGKQLNTSRIEHDITKINVKIEKLTMIYETKDRPVHEVAEANNLSRQRLYVILKAIGFEFNRLSDKSNKQLEIYNKSMYANVKRALEFLNKQVKILETTKQKINDLHSNIFGKQYPFEKIITK